MKSTRETTNARELLKKNLCALIKQQEANLEMLRMTFAQMEAEEAGGTETLTVAEAARLLGIAPSTLRDYTRAGKIPAYAVGQKKYTYRRSELESFLEKQKTQTQDALDVLAGTWCATHPLPRGLVNRR